MNRNWRDERNKTSFKTIFCILIAELVYNQDKKCTSPFEENISTERQTDRQTETERDTERENE